MGPDVFDSVTWDDVRTSIDAKPKMYQLWYAKQGNNHCGTGVMLERWSSHTKKEYCPNCGRRGEDANHLLRCGDDRRKQCLQRGVNELVKWMQEHDTHEGLRQHIPAYIRAQGLINFADLRDMSPLMRRIGHAQDRIGWRHFTEGRIALKIRDLQDMHLLQCGSRLTIQAWMKGFIGKLHEMTHGQWIFRNITKHHHTNGTIKLADRQEVFKEINRQLGMGIGSLPPESRCLLEIPRRDLMERSTESLQYWLYAVQAAREAAAHALSISKGTTASWSQIIKDGRFHAVPKQTPMPTPEDVIKEREEKEEQRKAPIKALKEKRTQEAKAKKANERSIKITKENKKWRSERKKQAKKKPKGALHSTPEIPRPSRDANEHDNKNLLVAPNTTKDETARLRKLMTLPTPHARAHHINNYVVTRKGNQSVLQHSKASLNEGEWVVDDVLEYYLRHLVEPTRTGVQCYGTHFASKLLQINEEGVSAGYKFNGVRRYHIRRLDEDIWGLSQLFIPINKNQNHWMFVRVVFEQKRI
jgi:hypothetical protein